MRKLIISPEKYVQGGEFFEILKENESADGSEHEGPTGNEGAPYSRWYQRAAILIWPRQSRIKLLGCEAAFGMIHAAINGDKSAICGYELLHAEPIGRHTRQDDCDL